MSHPLGEQTGYKIKVESIEVDGGKTLEIRSLLDRMQFSDDEGIAEALGISSAQWPLFGLVLPSMKYSVGHWFRENPNLGKFSLIIGSDVLYDRMYPSNLAKFIQLHALPSAQVLIVDPNRGNSAEFCKIMKNNGFTLSQSMLKGPLYDYSPYRGRLLNFLRE